MRDFGGTDERVSLQPLQRSSSSTVWCSSRGGNQARFKGGKGTPPVWFWTCFISFHRADGERYTICELVLCYSYRKFVQLNSSFSNWTLVGMHGAFVFEKPKDSSSFLIRPSYLTRTLRGCCRWFSARLPPPALPSRLPLLLPNARAFPSSSSHP